MNLSEPSYVEPAYVGTVRLTKFFSSNFQTSSLLLPGLAFLYSSQFCLSFFQVDSWGDSPSDCWVFWTFGWECNLIQLSQCTLILTAVAKDLISIDGFLTRYVKTCPILNYYVILLITPNDENSRSPSTPNYLYLCIYEWICFLFIKKE